MLRRVSLLALGCALACGGTNASQAPDGGSGGIGATADLLAISLSQTDLRLPSGASTAFAVTGTYRNGTQADVTGLAQATSSNPAVATVAHASGAQILVTAVAGGTAVITVVVGALTQAAVVTVSGPAAVDGGVASSDGGQSFADAGAGTAQLVGISLSQTDIRIPAGANTAFAVTGMYSDGTRQDLSQQCIVSTSNAAVASVQQGPGAQVQVFANAEGSAVITVAYGQFTQTANVTVSRRAD